MKKLIFSALTIFLLSTVAVFAQDAGETTPEVQDQETPADIAQEQMSEVSLQELPASILNTLQEEYEEWAPIASYIVNDEEAGQYYAVDLQKEDEIQTVNFDVQGNKIEGDNDETEDLE